MTELKFKEGDTVYLFLANKLNTKDVKGSYIDMTAISAIDIIIGEVIGWKVEKSYSCYTELYDIELQFICSPVANNIIKSEYEIKTISGIDGDNLYSSFDELWDDVNSSKKIIKEFSEMEKIPLNKDFLRSGYGKK